MVQPVSDRSPFRSVAGTQILRLIWGTWEGKWGVFTVPLVAARAFGSKRPSSSVP